MSNTRCKCLHEITAHDMHQHGPCRLCKCNGFMRDESVDERRARRDIEALEAVHASRVGALTRERDELRGMGEMLKALMHEHDHSTEGWPAASVMVCGTCAKAEQDLLEQQNARMRELLQIVYDWGGSVEGGEPYYQIEAFLRSLASAVEGSEEKRDGRT